MNAAADRTGTPPWWRVARWMAADYLYAGWRQLAALGAWLPSSYLLRGDPALPEVVLVPGVYEHWTFLRPLAERLNAAGHRVRTVHGLGVNRHPIPSTAARLERALARVPAPAAGRIIVAHSKGGLIGKRLLVDLVAARAGGDAAAGAGAPWGAAARAGVARDSGVSGVVAIATPFNGARRARFFVDPVVREFLPNEPTIRALAEAREVDARIVSISGPFDPHVPEGSDLEGARNVRVPTPGHFRILGAPETADAVLDGISGLVGAEH
ncbi:esterase/lipase family protein [Agromyces soli]